MKKVIHTRIGGNVATLTLRHTFTVQPWLEGGKRHSLCHLMGLITNPKEGDGAEILPSYSFIMEGEI